MMSVEYIQYKTKFTKGDVYADTRLFKLDSTNHSPCAYP